MFDAVALKRLARLVPPVRRLSERIHTLKTRVSELEGRNATLQKDLLADRKARAALEEQLNQVSSARDQLAAQVSHSGEQLNQVSSARDQLAAQLKRSSEEGEASRRRVAALEKSLEISSGREKFLDERLSAQTGNYRIHRAEKGSVPAADEIEAECLRMRELIEAAGGEYVPSEFWSYYYGVNLQQIRGAGLHNFKLTISRNYHNYLIGSLFDRKLRNLMKWYKERGAADLHFLFSAIEDPDFLDPSLFLIHPTTQLFGGDPAARLRYRCFVVLLWEFMRERDKLGLVDRMSEPETGNPIRVMHRGKLISQDLSTSISEANDIVPPLRRRLEGRPGGILEVGAGYGRLAHVLKSAMDLKRYVIVDIPPAIFVSRWYLSQLYPEARIFGVEDFSDWTEISARAAEADFLFLLPHQLPLMPDNFVDAALSVSALHEMVPTQANWYLQEMGRSARHLIYSKQYWEYTNPHDDLVFDVTQYKYPDGFSEVLSKKDQINDLFFNKLLGRSED